MSAGSSQRYAKRIARQLYRNMDRSLSKIQSLHEMFDDGHHAEHTELLTLIAQIQIQVQEGSVAFYRLAWGATPGDWYADVGS